MSTNSPFTYNGMPVTQLIDEINDYVKDHSPIKVDYGSHLRESRYAYITQDHLLEHRKDTESNGMHDDAWFPYGGYAHKLEGADLEAVHQEVMEFHKNHPVWVKAVYVKVATPEQWSDHNDKWERELGRNPEKYGWLLMSKVCELTGLTEQEIRQTIDDKIGKTGIVGVAGDDRKTTVVEKAVLREAGFLSEEKA